MEVNKILKADRLEFVSLGAQFLIFHSNIFYIKTYMYTNFISPFYFRCHIGCYMKITYDTHDFLLIYIETYTSIYFTVILHYHE